MKETAYENFGYEIADIESAIFPIEGLDGLWHAVEGVPALKLEAVVSKFETLFKERVWRSIAFWTDTEIDLSSASSILSNADAEEFRKHLVGVINMSIPRYATLIVELDSVRESLLDDVESVTTTRNWNNDTPQNSNLNAESEDLSHLSTFNKNESVAKTPMTTPADRLSEVSEKIGMYFKDWTDFVISSLHLED